MRQLNVIQSAPDGAPARAPADGSGGDGESLPNRRAELAHGTGQKSSEAAPSPEDWPARKPDWMKVKAPGGDNYRRLKRLMRGMELNSVCEEAHCPNIGECWEKGTATFLIMGDTCTRNCPYCAIGHGRPQELDLDEPRRVAEAIETLDLNHCVITSVDRDDLPDGGARIFADTIREIRARLPDCSIEVLTPDFQGDEEAVATVVEARPAIFNHNMETVERLHDTARPGGRYERSLRVLEAARRLDDEVLVKTGIMLGLGETADDVEAFMDDALDAGIQILTLGQYLRPSEDHLPIDRYVTPEEFDRWKAYGEEKGFLHVESGPLVRSSYHAREQVEELKLRASGRDGRPGAADGAGARAGPAGGADGGGARSGPAGGAGSPGTDGGDRGARDRPGGGARASA